MIRAELKSSSLNFFSSVKPTEKEIPIAKLVRKSIVANVDIPEGATITGDMLIIKRPGTGIPSKYLNEVIGKKAKTIIKEDNLIQENDLT